MASSLLTHLSLALFLCAFWRCGAAEKQLRRSPDDDYSAMPESVQAMLTGTMVLAAALPHHGPPASQKEQDQMAEAGQLLYKANVMFGNAEQGIDAAYEQLRLQSTGTKTSNSVASEISDSDKQVYNAKAKLKEGEKLYNMAKDSFFNRASPLGDPPVAPHEWDNVNSMGQRARAKWNALGEKLSDTKKYARERGVALIDITVAQEKSVVIADAYGAKKDNEILDFLNGY